MKRELRFFAWLASAFLFAYFVPFAHPAVRNAVGEALGMLQEYARDHVLLCLVPALFIAGAIAIFVNQAGVIRYLGAGAKKVVAYSVASVSGAILAVCSCTILPLFAGIYKRGAGLGPAVAFLYSGPAINVLAIILTGRILGLNFGLARALGAVAFSIVIGLAMHLIFRKEHATHEAAIPATDKEHTRPLWKTVSYIAVMIGILVFANWGRPGSVVVQLEDGREFTAIRAGESTDALLVKPGGDQQKVQVIPKTLIRSFSYAPSMYTSIYRARFVIAGTLLVLLLILVTRWFAKSEIVAWGGSTWTYAKLILPYLFGGVLIAGFLLGRPGQAALIPSDWIGRLVGGNGWLANAFASVAGALMYFATLTELPIIQGLQGAGMGNGPALALLLAGPALSLPNMLVIRKVLGTKKTLVYIALVCIAATLTGKLFGTLMGN
jgi:uncharacterized membrane protein YraQ (UPF0718 family)